MIYTRPINSSVCLETATQTIPKGKSAKRIGRSDQCGQTPTRIESLSISRRWSISRRCRHETMGWIGCHRGQPDRYRKNVGASGDKVRGQTRERDERLEKSKATRTAGKRRCSGQFTTPILAPESSYAFSQTALRKSGPSGSRFPAQSAKKQF